MFIYWLYWFDKYTGLIKLYTIIIYWFDKIEKKHVDVTIGNQFSLLFLLIKSENQIKYLRIKVKIMSIDY